MQLAQLGFKDQAVERRAHLMGDNRHEIVAHAHRVFQLTTGDLQLGQQLLLLFPAALQRLQLLIEGLALAEQVDKHRHFAFHRLVVQRLVQEVHGTTFIAFEGIVHFTPGSADKDDRDVLGLLRAAHQLGQLETVHARHLHIENGQGELMFKQQRQRLVGGLCLIHLTVAALDQRLQCQQVFRQVVDDQQFGLDVA
ncbi:hypothetical protein D3C84_636640 [compost metagenome]